MKYLLMSVLEDNEYSNALLHDLAKKGFNATVLNSTSLRHVLHSETADVPFFVSLNMLTRNGSFEGNTTIMLVLEQNDLETAQEIIRNMTDNFKKVRGGMFLIKLEKYEGSF